MVRKYIAVYHEVSKTISETWQAEKWLKETDCAVFRSCLTYGCTESFVCGVRMELEGFIINALP